MVPKGYQEMVASIIRTILAQPDREHIEKQFAEVTTMLGRAHPKVAALLDAQPDLLAFAAYPRRHWRQIWSTNSLERVNKEIKRRTDVVGVFPNPAALLRLAGSVLIEQHDEWEAGERRYFSESSMLELAVMNNPVEVIDEAVILPELIAGQTKTTDPHGVEKLHHSAGRDPRHTPLSSIQDDRGSRDAQATSG